MVGGGGGGAVTKMLVKWKRRVTFLSTLRRGRARIFYIAVDGGSSGPHLLLKNECSLISLVCSVGTASYGSSFFSFLVFIAQALRP